MSDSTIRNKTPSELEETAEDEEGRISAWLKEADKVGALPEAHAAYDVAFAQGYAVGQEQARDEDLDALRTILLRWLEGRFGEVRPETLDKIEAANWSALERWLLALPEADSEETALAD